MSSSDVRLSEPFWNCALKLDLYDKNNLQDKIDKVPWGIQGEKSSKDMANSRNLVSTIGAQIY